MLKSVSYWLNVCPSRKNCGSLLIYPPFSNYINHVCKWISLQKVLTTGINRQNLIVKYSSPQKKKVTTNTWHLNIEIVAIIHGIVGLDYVFQVLYDAINMYMLVSVFWFCITLQVELKEGPLDQFTHEMEPFLRKQGMPVRLSRGLHSLSYKIHHTCTKQQKPRKNRVS